MDRQALLAKVNPAECIDFLARMVRFRSYSDTPGETKLAQFMVDEMSRLGISARLHHVVGERCNAVGTLPGVGGGKSLLFNGHLDTNPVTEGWTVDPLAGVHDDEFVYGIGVSNMKAGDAAFFCAARTLVEQGVRLQGDVVLTFVIGELQGGIGAVKMIEDGVRADYFINAEPTDLNALTLHAGSLFFTVELTGHTRHISKREEAVDSIAAACALVPRINAMTFSGATSPEYVGITRAHVGVARGSLSRDFLDWRPAQVADFARLQGAARYAPSQSEESVLGDIQRLLADLEVEFPGLKWEVRRQDDGDRPMRLPFEVAPTARIVRVVNDAYKTVRGTGQQTGAIPPYCFYGTDAAHLQHLAGMEGIVCGPGGKFNTMPDERVELRDYLDMIKIYLLTIMDICGVQE